MKRILAVLVILILLSSGCVNQDDSSGDQSGDDAYRAPNGTGDAGQYDTHDVEECSAPVFTHYFVDPEKVRVVQPLGVVHGSGKITVGRSYVSFKEEYDDEKIPVYAPAGLTTKFGSYYTGGSEPGENTLPDYAITFDLGCGYRLSFAHLKEMAPKIVEIMPELSESSAGVDIERIEIKAGEVIGYFISNAGVTGIDIIVESDSVTNHFANQERYEKYGSNLLHVICPYDLYTGDMREAYYDLFGGGFLTRTGIRDCGTVERDINGTISGMWFLDEVPLRSVHDTVKEGIYGSPMPIADDGERIVVGRIDEANIWIAHDNPTYKDPTEVTDEHCYQNMLTPETHDGYVYFKVISDMEMRAFISETGSCPESFPGEGWVSYYR